MSTFQKISALGVLAVCVFLITWNMGNAIAKSEGVWKRVCGDEGNIESCRISQQIFLSQKDKEGNDRVAGRVLGLSVLYVQEGEVGKKQPFLAMQMPLGVDLRPGAVFKIDDGPEVKVNYLQCTNAGCDASLPIDSNMMLSMRGGKQMSVGFRPWGSERAMVLNASLSGFDKALKSIR